MNFTGQIIKKYTVPKIQIQTRKLKADIFTLLKKQGLKVGPDLLVINRNLSKQKIRGIHTHARQEKLIHEASFISQWYPRIKKYFASGTDIIPEKIDPYLVVVEESEELAALFRIACLWWSIPVSRGFGRRFRILVFDRSNKKLIGLIGFADPVFNLRTRDTWIGWDVHDREKRLVHTMDAYVLGAVPPYNQLLGAKLVSLLATSNFIRQVFERRYKNTKSVILGRKFNGQLALVTTTSALGRSSILNRLTYEGKDVFQNVGFTEGYGHFHLANGTFEKFREYLCVCGDNEAEKYRFGSGPNYRMRVVRKVLEHLHLPADLLRHGVKRGVYVAPLASNSQAFLRGEVKALKLYNRPVRKLAEFWKCRWLLPRSFRDQNYRNFRDSQWEKILELK